MNQASIESGIYNWVNAVIGVSATVLWSDQDFPRAGKPFVTLRLGTQNMLGSFDEVSNPDGAGLATISGERTMMVTIESYGTTAFDLINSVLNSLSKESVRQSLYNDGGIAVHRTENILKLTEVVDTNFEQRFSMDVIIGYKHVDTEQVSWIETIEIEGEIDNFGDTKTVGPFIVTLT